MLRIATDDSNSVCPLSVKFGATLKGCRALLQRAMELSLDVIGVSFHVGSMCRDPGTYTQAISDARCVFDMAVSLAPFNLKMGSIVGSLQLLHPLSLLPSPGGVWLQDEPAGHWGRVPWLGGCQTQI